MTRLQYPRPIGPRLRRTWSTRALRKMTRDLSGEGDGRGPRPAFWVSIPGPMGLSEGVDRMPDCDDIGEDSAPAQKVLGALGLLDDRGYLADPRNTKNFHLGVKNGRWHLSGCFYDRQQPRYNEGLADLADLINKVQSVTGRCAAVGGVEDKNAKRPARRFLPFCRAHELFSMVRAREDVVWKRLVVHDVQVNDLWAMMFNREL